MPKSSLILTVFACLSSMVSGQQQRSLSAHVDRAECPPSGFSVKQNFDPSTYITKPWYSVKQLEVQFQEKDTFNCVRAQYTLDTDKYWWCRLFFMCNKLRIKVNNQGRIGSVNGPLTTAELYAFVNDASEPSKLRVGPRFLPPLINGPYWVLEAGSYAELLNGEQRFESTDYEWALISGGPPKISSNGKCITGMPGPDTRNGFWYFSARPVPPPGVIQALDALAEKSFGIDTSLLQPVNQQGCSFD